MKEEENEEVQPPSFWRQLFCKHHWVKLPNQSLYDGPESLKADLPTKVYSRWECTKCLKYRRYRVG